MRMPLTPHDIQRHRCVPLLVKPNRTITFPQRVQRFFVLFRPHSGLIVHQDKTKTARENRFCRFFSRNYQHEMSLNSLAGKIDELDERINELENRGTRETIETDGFSD